MATDSLDINEMRVVLADLPQVRKPHAFCFQSKDLRSPPASPPSLLSKHCVLSLSLSRSLSLSFCSFCFCFLCSQCSHSWSTDVSDYGGKLVASVLA